MIDAARGFSTSKPLRIDHMKKNKPMIESKKAPNKLNIALSIGVLPFLLGAQTAHGYIDPTQHATRKFLIMKSLW